MPFSAKTGFFSQQATGGGTPWTPADITTQVWVKAEASELTLSGTDVTAWNNKGSGGTNFSQATGSQQPTWDSTNGWVLFDGVDDILQANSFQGFSSGTVETITTVAVVNVEDYDPQFSGVAGKFFQIGGNPGGSAGTVYSIATGSEDLSVGWNYRFNTGFTSFNNGVLDADKITSWQNSAGEQYQNFQFFLDGDEKTKSGGNNGSTGLSLTNQPYSYLGGGPGGSTSQVMYSNIKLYELVCIKEDSDDTRQKLEGYLAWEHGLEGNLPVDHPYKNAAPTT